MTLDEWTGQVSEALGLGLDRDLDFDPASMRALVLDLARDAAHGIARPAAPLTTFLLGIAVGRGADRDTAAAAVRALIPIPEPPDDPPVG